MSEQEENQNMGGNDAALLQSVLASNLLSYRLSPDVSVAVSRTTQQAQFQTQSIDPATSCSCIFNSGSSFVDLSRSTLVLTVKNTGAENVTFGLGTAVNLLGTSTLLARTGACLERLDDCMQWGIINHHLHRPLGIDSAASSYDTDSFPVGSVMRFCIPFPAFSEFANSAPLIPPQLASGMTLSLYFNAAANAFANQDGTTTTRNYQIVAARCDLMCIQLSDSITKTLSQISASQGLEVVGSTVHCTRSIRAQSNFSLDASKACSRALQLYYYERSADVVWDPSKSITLGAGCAVKEYQSRIGQLYYPQSSVRVYELANNAGWQTSAAELFSRTLIACNRQCGSSNLSFAKYAASGLFVISEDLQRSSSLTSGVPLSGSRLANVAISFNETTIPKNLVSLFVKHQILVRCFLSSCVLES